MDKGPWSLFYGPPPKRELLGVISEDFERDVVLKVSGDFTDHGEKERYCNWLLGVLNTRAQ
jgi:hypothetical protein